MIPCANCGEPVAIYTTEGAAEALGVTRTAIRQRAARRGITGTRLDSRTLVYSGAEVEGMRVEQVRGRKKGLLVRPVRIDAACDD